MAGLAAVLGVGACHDLGRSVGWVGQPGIVWLTACHDEGSGRTSQVRCDGAFAADGSKSASMAHTTDGNSHPTNTPIRGRSDGDSGVTVTTPGGVMTAIGEVMLCLGFVIFGVCLMILAVAVNKLRRGTRQRDRGDVLGKALVALVVGGFALMIAGGFVS